MTKTWGIDRLVVNGCSYMDHYARGNGHIDLADKFNIQTTTSLSKSGSSNDRIVRTTLQDAYNNKNTLYVIGTTFLYRFEIPVLIVNDTTKEYRSFTPNGIFINDNETLSGGITLDDIKKYSELRLKFDVEEFLVYNTVYAYTSMIDSLINNGHQVILFNTAEICFERYTDDPNLKYLNNYNKYIVDKFNWYSNQYQLDKGASVDKADIDRSIPDVFKHIASGQHKHLNEFLYDHINNNFYV